MCGIAGIIDCTGRPVLQEELKQMTDAIAHRGPDGEGFFIADNVGFGHRRLAVIDLSNAAAQPMCRFGLTITYNGEIYNYIELRKELEQHAISFSTQSDTEVVLAAYHVWGKKCVQHFNGMWAFAIYDEARKEIFISRDRFGEKPLYYLHQNQRFIFCSEIKGILAVASSVACNEEMAKAYLQFGIAEHQRQTFFHQIFKLPPSHSFSIHLSSGKIDEQAYYDMPMPAAITTVSEKEAIEGLAYWMTESISIRLRSDVAVGVCLSGGIDSSAIAGIAATLLHELGGKSLSAITATTKDARTNEAPYANMVADVHQLDWHAVSVDDNAAALHLSNLIAVQDEPFVSPSVGMQYLVMQQAKKTGLKVLMDGQGADELLLGYPAHIPAKLKANTTLRLAKQIMHNSNIGLTTLIRLLLSESAPTLRLQYNRQLMKSLGWKMEQSALATDLVEKAAAAQKTGLSATRKFALQYGSLPSLLRYEDHNAMHFSVETRLPFLDHRLMEYVVNLPDVWLYKNGWSKYLLRKVLEPKLPPAVAWRRNKIGFEAPANTWHTDLLGMEKLCEQSRLLKRYCININPDKKIQAQWRAVSLAIWENRFLCNQQTVL